LGLVISLGATGFVRRSAAAPQDPRGAEEASITRLTTGLLEHSQFAHHPFDRELAGALLDRYLDALDGSRSLFLQSDVDKFAGYRSVLAQDTRGAGDTHVAQAIFERYLERLGQQVAYVTGELRTGSFDFTGHDVYSFDREHAPRPGDLTAAEALWRQQLRAEYLQEKLGGKRPSVVVSTLTKRYAQQLKTARSLHPEEVLEIYLDALTHVYDPHSDYLGHEQMDSLSIAMNLSLVGIGATLEASEGYCKILSLVPGGPAARSGLLKAGDRIVAVAQPGQEPIDVVNMPLSRAVELIRGPKGSPVTLEVIPSGAADGSPPRTVSIMRDEVKLEDQAAKARIVDLPTGHGDTVRLGVIDLPSFYADMSGHNGARRRSATADVARLLAKLKDEHVRGVVLDLRRNGGGSLDEAITLTGLFIRKGPVVQTRDQAGDVEVGADPDPAVAYDGPLVVLTSRFSASASEILTGALKDYGRALVVGDSSTFGKGTVQNIIPLARVMDRMGLAHAYDPGALKVTISKFYRPSGASTQLRGVASDIVLPSPSDFRDVSESALKDPLPWDTVPPAPYERLDRVQPYVGELRQRSARRVAGEQDFAFVADDVARLRHNLATKSVSPNEAERRAEMARDKASHEEREREELTLHASEPRTYDITLEDAASPGLPAPVAFTKDGKETSPAASTAARPGPGEPAVDQDEDESIELTECERILADYVDLSRSPGLRGAHRATNSGWPSHSRLALALRLKLVASSPNEDPPSPVHCRRTPASRAHDRRLP
jgi:carboxyl-terminal processing protease